MFSLMNPKVIIAIVVALIAAFGYGHHVAYLEQAEEVSRLNDVARKKEQELVELANASARNLQEEQEYARKQISDLKSAVADGSMRLSIATRRVQTSSNAGVACGAVESERAELDPKAAQDLVAIAADGDEATRQLVALIAFYNKVREETNGSHR